MVVEPSLRVDGQDVVRRDLPPRDVSPLVGPDVQRLEPGARYESFEELCCRDLHERYRLKCSLIPLRIAALVWVFQR